MLAPEVRAASLFNTARWIISCEFWIEMSSTPAERTLWKEELNRARASFRAAFSGMSSWSAEYERHRDGENATARQRLVEAEGHCHAFVVPEFDPDGSHAPIGDNDYPFGYKHYRRAYAVISRKEKKNEQVKPAGGIHLHDV